jgi:hypothetical protein
VKPGSTGTEAPDAPSDTEREDSPEGRRIPADSGEESMNIPQQPAQGVVSAALRPFLSNARKCVAGASDVSRVTIVFGSNGSVKRVEVGGWAEANGATGCVTSALMGANVGRFWKPYFLVTHGLRP